MEGGKNTIKEKSQESKHGTSYETSKKTETTMQFATINKNHKNIANGTYDQYVAPIVVFMDK